MDDDAVIIINQGCAPAVHVTDVLLAVSRNGMYELTHYIDTRLSRIPITKITPRTFKTIKPHMNIEKMSIFLGVGSISSIHIYFIGRRPWSRIRRTVEIPRPVSSKAPHGRMEAHVSPAPCPNVDGDVHRVESEDGDAPVSNLKGNMSAQMSFKPIIH